MRDAERPWIVALQLASIAWMWVFVIGISLWILNLIVVSRRLDDAPGASMAISLVAIPVFLTGASVLTYVFVGLWKERGSDPSAGAETDR